MILTTFAWLQLHFDNNTMVEAQLYDMSHWNTIVNDTYGESIVIGTWFGIYVTPALYRWWILSFVICIIIDCICMQKASIIQQFLSHHLNKFSTNRNDLWKFNRGGHHLYDFPCQNVKVNWNTKTAWMCSMVERNGFHS